jgi:hypothetical protein
MRLSVALLMGVVALGASLPGCGGGNAGFTESVDQNYVNNLKSDLETIVKNGRLGSGMGTISSNIRAIKAKDAAKGEALEKAFTELSSAKGEAQVKEKANELIKLL